MLDAEDDHHQDQPKKVSLIRTQTKSTRRARHHDKDETDEIPSKPRSKPTKNPPKQRATSTMVTRNRRK